RACVGRVPGYGSNGIIAGAGWCEGRAMYGVDAQCTRTGTVADDQYAILADVGQQLQRRQTVKQTTETFALDQASAGKSRRAYRIRAQRGIAPVGTRLQYQNGLDAGDGTRRGHELAWLADVPKLQHDRACLWIECGVIEQVGDVDIRFGAGAGDPGKTDIAAQRPVVSGRAQRLRLR